MIVGRLNEQGVAEEVGMCVICNRQVNIRKHICREAMGQTRQRSANLDDLLFELRII